METPLTEFEYGLLAAKAEGTGKRYAETHDYRESPLSGEWAGEILPVDVIHALGLDPSTLEPEDFDALLDSWQNGYELYWGARI